MLFRSRGDMVFWGDTVPYWVVEWQPKNGTGVYWLINAAGKSAVAEPNELTLRPPIPKMPK